MKYNAFTLIELLIVIAVMGVLATVVLLMVNPEAQFQKIRNTQRKEDLRMLQQAVEKYNAYYGSYPTSGNNWCTTSPGIPGISYANCSGSPDFRLVTSGTLKKMPQDPRVNTANLGNPGCAASESSYLYRSDGTNYKILAHCTPEGTSAANTFSTSDAFYDPTRPTWAWQVSSPGALNW